VGGIVTTRLTEYILKNKKVDDEAKAGLCAHTRCAFSSKWFAAYEKKEADRRTTLLDFGIQKCPAAVASALSWTVARFFF